MEDKNSKEGPGPAAYLFTILFNWLVLALLGRWLKKYDIDLKKDGFKLYLMLLAAAWVMGCVLIILIVIGWQVYRLVMWFQGNPVE